LFHYPAPKKILSGTPAPRSTTIILYYFFFLN